MIAGARVQIFAVSDAFSRCAVITIPAVVRRGHDYWPGRRRTAAVPVGWSAPALARRTDDRAQPARPDICRAGGHLVAGTKRTARLADGAARDAPHPRRERVGAAPRPRALRDRDNRHRCVGGTPVAGPCRSCRIRPAVRRRTVDLVLRLRAQTLLCRYLLGVLSSGLGGMGARRRCRRRNDSNAPPGCVVDCRSHRALAGAWRAAGHTRLRRHHRGDIASTRGLARGVPIFGNRTGMARDLRLALQPGARRQPDQSVLCNGTGHSRSRLRPVASQQGCSGSRASSYRSR